MGEYEDRYPDAYGRENAAREQTPASPREEIVRPTARPPMREPGAPAAAMAPLSDVRPASGRPASDWQHEPAGTGTYRGLGPRGYTRSPQRIYEDICDRLTENPFIDASDVEVRVEGLAVTLSGSVDSGIASRQAEQIAAEVVGVSRVHNRLTVRVASRSTEPTPGDQVNRAMPSPARTR